MGKVRIYPWPQFIPQPLPPLKRCGSCCVRWTPPTGNPSSRLGMLLGERPDKSVPRSKGADDSAGSLRNHPSDFWEGRMCPGKANAAA